MKAKVYQVNANRDFLGVGFRHYNDPKIAKNPGEISAFFYDKVFEGDIDESEFEVGFYAFGNCAPYEERSVYISDVVEVIEAENMKPGFYYVNGDEYIKIDFDPNKASEKETIRVVFIDHKSPAVAVDIDATWASFSDLISGPIAYKYPKREDIRIICNAAGKGMKMTVSRVLFGAEKFAEIVHGPFFIFGSCKSNYESLTKEQEERYLRKFRRSGILAPAKL